MESQDVCTRVIFENVQVKEGDLVGVIPGLIMAESAASLSKSALFSEYGIENVMAVRCPSLMNHEKEFRHINDHEMRLEETTRLAFSMAHYVVRRLLEQLKTEFAKIISPGKKSQNEVINHQP